MSRFTREGPGALDRGWDSARPWDADRHPSLSPLTVPGDVVLAGIICGVEDRHRVATCLLASVEQYVGIVALRLGQFLELAQCRVLHLPHSLARHADFLGDLLECFRFPVH